MPSGTLENLSRSGFVRTPPAISARIIANLLCFGASANILDPTSGEGDLLIPCAGYPGMRLLGIENSEERADVSRERLPTAQIVTSDCMAVKVTPASVDLVLANPPYFFVDGLRAEYRIIKRFGEALRPGGVLVAILPARSAWTDGMIRHMATHYYDIRCWKFPDEADDAGESDFDRYTQIIVVGVRNAVVLDAPSVGEKARLKGWRWTRPKGAESPWGQGTPPSELPNRPLDVPYSVPEAGGVLPELHTLQATDAQLLEALTVSGAHLAAPWQQSTTWHVDVAAERPAMPPTGEAHLAADILTGLLDDEVIRGPSGERHVFSSYVTSAWVDIPVEEEVLQENYDKGVSKMSIRQQQDHMVLGALNLETGGITFHQGEDVFSFLSPWMSILATLVLERRQPLYALRPSKWEMRAVVKIGRDKRLPKAQHPGLVPPQQHRVYAMGHALDHLGYIAIQGEPGTGKTRQSLALAARQAVIWRYPREVQEESGGGLPAWRQRLRHAWMRNERLRSLLPPGAQGPKALPMLVMTPKRVTKTWRSELTAAYPTAEYVVIKDHRDILTWLRRCATSTAPMVLAIASHSHSRAFGRTWEPAVLERRVKRPVPLLQLSADCQQEYEEIREKSQVVGFRDRVTGQFLMTEEEVTHFYCPACGAKIRGKPHGAKIDRKTNEATTTNVDDDLAQPLEEEADELDVVTSRTYFTTKRRACADCDEPLWSEMRVNPKQRGIPFADWATATAVLESPSLQIAVTTAQAVARYQAAVDRKNRYQLAVARGEIAADPLRDAEELPLPPVQGIPAAEAHQEAVQRANTFAEAVAQAITDQRQYPPLYSPTQLADFVASELELDCECMVADALSGQSQPWPTAELERFVASTRERWEHERKAQALQAIHESIKLEVIVAGVHAEWQQRAPRVAKKPLVKITPQRFLAANGTRGPFPPDSFSPFEYLRRFFDGAVGLLVIDESHNGRGRATDIAQSMHNAMHASAMRVLATGTHYGGSLDSFFHYWFRFQPQFWLRLGLDWESVERAIREYGVIEQTTKEYEEDARKGTGRSDKHVTTLPAPGISAKLIPHLLQTLVFLTVLDTGTFMPLKKEIPVIVSMRDAELTDRLANAVAAYQDSERHVKEAHQTTIGMPQDADPALVMATVVAEQQAVTAEREAREHLDLTRDWVDRRDLYTHYQVLVKELQEFTRQQNTAAMLAKGTVPRWFAALPCIDPEYKVIAKARDDWGNVTGEKLLTATPVLEANWVYPLERELQKTVAREIAELSGDPENMTRGRRCMVYFEQNEVRNMGTRLSWVLREYNPWILPNSVDAEDREDAIRAAVERGHQVVIVPYKRVSEGLNLQFLDTLIWYEMAQNLFHLDQASRRAWRLGKANEVRIYYLAYAGSAAHRKLQKLGSQSGAAAAFMGEPAKGALIEHAGADKTMLARLSHSLEVVEQDLERDADDELRERFAQRDRELEAALANGRKWMGIDDPLLLLLEPIYRELEEALESNTASVTTPQPIVPVKTVEPPVVPAMPSVWEGPAPSVTLPTPPTGLPLWSDPALFKAAFPRRAKKRERLQAEHIATAAAVTNTGKSAKANNAVNTFPSGSLWATLVENSAESAQPPIQHSLFD